METREMETVVETLPGGVVIKMETGSVLCLAQEAQALARKGSRFPESRGNRHLRVRAGVRGLSAPTVGLASRPWGR